MKLEPFEWTEIEEMLDNVIMPALRAGIPGPKLGSWRRDIDCETAYLSFKLAE